MELESDRAALDVAVTSLGLVLAAVRLLAGVRAVVATVTGPGLDTTL